MAITKASLFSEKQIRTAELAKTIAHPARIAILEILSRRSTCICGDISDELPLAQSTVSQHLKALKNAGIIQGTVEGVRSCYCLNPETVAELKTLLEYFFTQITSDGEACC